MRSSTKGLGEVISPFLATLIDLRFSSTARGLPDGGQSGVAEVYLKSVTAEWTRPTEDFIKKATNLLKTFIEKVIKARCGHLSYGALHVHLRCGHTST